MYENVPHRGVFFVFIEDFNKALQKRIEAKQGEYDALMKNLSIGALPPAVVADIGEQMQTIKAEIVQLQETTPPTDFTVDQIKAWLRSGGHWSCKIINAHR